MLLIGVITSIFTAVVATRAMLGVLSGLSFMGSRWVLGSVGTGDRWKRFDFIGRKNVWFAISGLILVIGAISLGTKGLNRGIDFTGGSKLTFVTPKPASVGAATGAVTAAGLNEPQVQGVTSTRGQQGSTYTQFQVESHLYTGYDDVDWAAVVALGEAFGLPLPAAGAPGFVQARRQRASR